MPLAMHVIVFVVLERVIQKQAEKKTMGRTNRGSPS
jgi:hypothetical protein